LNNLVGSQIGNFRLLKLLGQGSSAQVYLGEHQELKTPVAIKILTSPFNEEQSDIILKEAQTIARLSHPHIVRVLDFDAYNSFPYLVMDYYPNGSLRQHHPKGSAVVLDTVIAYTMQIASALQYAHDNSIIHRDIKPENLLLSQQNEVVLTDFGIATMTQSIRQTKQEIAGTALYMAPEQFKGNAGRASDQYALGVIIYEWLAGRPPFVGSVGELAGQHMLIAPPPLRSYSPAVPVHVEEVIMRALMKDPQQRFATVQEFANALLQAYQASTQQLLHTYLPGIPANIEKVIMRAFVKDPQQRFATVQEFANALLQAYQASATPAIISGGVIRKKRQPGKKTVVSMLISLILLMSIIPASMVTGILRLWPDIHPCMGFPDKFQQNNVNGWTWINPANKSTYAIEADPQNEQANVLHISSSGTPPYEDLNPKNENAPRLVQPIDGDFSIETQVDFTPRADGGYQGAGLLVWHDAHDFFRLDVSAWKGQFYGVDFVHFDPGHPTGVDNGGKIGIGDATIKLRVERKGAVYTASWEQYNKPWVTITRTFTASSDRVNAGLLLMNAQPLPDNGPVSSADAYYHYFHYTCNNS
jgi:serine/threonine protein kinase